MKLRIAILALVTMSPIGLWAEPVVLTSHDGSIKVEGTLISYENELFRIETDAGALTMDGGTFVCGGADCPNADLITARATIAGPAEIIHRLISPLVEVYAARQGYSLSRNFTDDSSLTWELSLDSGQLVAVLDGRVSSDEEALSALRAEGLTMAVGRLEGGLGSSQDVLALDALVPVVAPDNPRAMVTLEQLQGLLSERISNWSRLAGPDLPVALHLPQGRTALLGKLQPARRVASAVRYIDPDMLSDAVASDPAALGIAPFSAIGNSVPLVMSGTCGLAIPATRDTIRAEDYPLTEPIFLHRLGATQPKIIRDFIAFARSHEAQSVIRDAGFVDQAIGRIGFERQGDRLANAVLGAGDKPDAIRAIQQMIGALMRGQRLTLTFRFRDGSSELDPQSVSNLRRLADAIGRGDFDQQSIVFVGFSDGIGPADGNLRLSKRRAQSVRSAVASLMDGAPVELSVEAYGEAMPMACDDTSWGRQVNRRVEVWLH